MRASKRLSDLCRVLCSAEGVPCIGVGVGCGGDDCDNDGDDDCDDDGDGDAAFASGVAADGSTSWLTTTTMRRSRASWGQHRINSAALGIKETSKWAAATTMAATFTRR